jgi:hypothetical protein
MRRPHTPVPRESSNNGSLLSLSSADVHSKMHGGLTVKKVSEFSAPPVTSATPPATSTTTATASATETIAGKKVGETEKYANDDDNNEMSMKETDLGENYERIALALRSITQDFSQEGISEREASQQSDLAKFIMKKSSQRLQELGERFRETDSKRSAVIRDVEEWLLEKGLTLESEVEDLGLNMSAGSLSQRGKNHSTQTPTSTQQQQQQRQPPSHETSTGLEGSAKGTSNSASAKISSTSAAPSTAVSSVAAVVNGRGKVGEQMENKDGFKRVALQGQAAESLRKLAARFGSAR